MQEGVKVALAEDVPADRISNEALIPAMAEVGRLFEAQEYYVPEMLISAKAMQGGLALLKPLLAASGAQAGPQVAFGTVKGDLHDIGKNLVIMMLEGAGFQVAVLGVDVYPDKFVQAVKDGAQLIGMSAMLTTTMPNMKVTIDVLKDAGVRDGVKVMIVSEKLFLDMIASLSETEEELNQLKSLNIQEKVERMEKITRDLGTKFKALSYREYLGEEKDEYLE